MPPTQAVINTIFGGSAAATFIPLEGAIKLYSDPHCNTPISSSATSILLGTCYNAPTTGISAISISSLPSCPNDTTPLLIVSNVKDCKNPAIERSINTHAMDECQGFSSSVEKTGIASAEFVCYPRGGSAIQVRAEHTSKKGLEIYSRQSEDDDDDSDSVSIKCECCNSGCVMM